MKLRTAIPALLTADAKKGQYAREASQECKIGIAGLACVAMECVKKARLAMLVSMTADAKKAPYATQEDAAPDLTYAATAYAKKESSATIVMKTAPAAQQRSALKRNVFRTNLSRDSRL